MPGFASTLAATIEHEIEITRSRFLVRISPVTDVAAAEAEIAARRKQFWDARHHCTAMVTGLHADQARSSDDGEPSGTAGIPMLEVLRRRDLTDLVAIVTRYFGGIKLGAGGLVRAYSTAVSETLDRAVIVRRGIRREVIIDVPLAEAGRWENLLREWTGARDAVMGAAAYASSATFTIWASRDVADALHGAAATWSSGAITARFGADRVMELRSA